MAGKTRVMALVLGAGLLAAGSAQAAVKKGEPKAAPKAAIERTGSPQAPIVSTAAVPAGSKLLFVSGTTASPLDPAKPEEFGDTAAQTKSILTKMKAQLEGMGWGLGDIVKMTVFLVGTPEKGGHMDAPGMNEVFRTFFGTAEQPNKPTRSTVQVAQLGRPTTLVEIEAIAAKAP